jgi:hypothetical protein
MKFEIKLDWAWILRKVRIAFLVAVFWALYTYVAAVFAFMWLAYFILNDLTDIEVTIEEDREERHNAWKSISTKRKGF